MAKQDLIHVNVTRVKEVPANAAHIYVTVQGSSMVRGSEALRKAKEVGHLFAELTSSGVGADDIQLRGMSAVRETGTVLKSSSARYRLRVHCRDLDRLPDLIGIISSQKSVTLEYIDWRYPFEEDDAQRDDWMDECMARADVKARRMAKALGVKILGVHLVTEGQPPHRNLEMMAHMEDTAVRAVGVTRADLGLEMMHTKQVAVQVNVHYRVSGFAEDTRV